MCSEVQMSKPKNKRVNLMLTPENDDYLRNVKLLERQYRGVGGMMRYINDLIDNDRLGKSAEVKQ